MTLWSLVVHQPGRGRCAAQAHTYNRRAMALITRCPACGTLFKVVPDQLRISDGWVRCGHCAEIFDAHQHMQTLPPDSLGGPVPGTRVPGPDDGRVDAAGAAARLGSVRDSVDTRPAAIQPPTQGPRLPPFTEAALRLPPAPAGPYHPGAAGPAPRVGLQPARGQSPVDIRATEVPDLDSVFAPVAPAPEPSAVDGPPAMVPDRVSAPRAFPATPTVPDGSAGAAPVPQAETDMAPAAAGRTGPAAEPSLQDVSFVRQARRRAFWRRPAVRVMLCLLLLGLTALLLTQFAVHERDRIAAIRPDLAPWLDRLCAPLGCAVGPLRHIEAIVIDGSAFGRLRDNRYRLDITLRNRSVLAVAIPAVELTITDTQDQPLVRRVLLPEELGARGPTLAGGAEWSTQVGLVVDAGGARVAGYRMLIFYP